MTRTYSEAMHISDYYKRFDYLKLTGVVGKETFASARYINQGFYRSREWKQTRNRIIARDLGRDLGHPDFPIGGKILVHHINPITEQDILDGSPMLFSHNNLICVSHNTHNAIHFGDISLLPQPLVERAPNDTIPWR